MPSSSPTPYRFAPAFLMGPLLLALAAGVVALLLYRLGWSGGWHFDDAPNLDGLATVFAQGRINWPAALDFVFAGDAGPLGRPLALVSFLLDGSTWPRSPRAMLYTNSLLHLLNAALLCGLWLAVLRLRGWAQQGASWVAVAAALLWLWQPLLASGVLMPVQRMTVLSSTFMLAGLWLYVLGREQLQLQQHLPQPPQSPLRAWLLMVLGLGAGTTLGILTKEQAALLPTLAWVLEACLLPAPHFAQARARRWWQGFKAVAFYLPTAAIAGYMLRIVPHAQATYAGRDFEMAERLWTQALITWEYLRLGLLPRALALGPFHDDYAAQGLGWATGMAACAWLLALVLAWRLRQRQRTPWPLFALLWWWAAHALESTLIPLELYFEHRNYLAISGVLLALVAGGAQWAQAQAGRIRLLAGLLAVYAALLAVVLWQVVALFGQPPVAAQLWAAQHPQSARAAQYWAGIQSQLNDVAGAQATLDAAAQVQHGHAGGLALQGLQLGCVLNAPEAELQQRLTQVLHGLAQAQKRFSIMDALGKLKTLHEQGDCNGFITRDRLLAIAQAGLDNPRLSSHRQERSNLHVLMAALYIEARDLGSTMAHLEAALQAMPLLQTMQLAAAVLNSAGLSEQALLLMDEHPPTLPRNPWARQRLQQQWSALAQQLRQAASEQAQSAPVSTPAPAPAGAERPALL